MRKESVLMILLTGVFILFGTLSAAENSSTGKQPELSVVPSKYINFTSTNFAVSNGKMLFDGTFVVLGQGVYGHFDVAAYDGSGKSIQTYSSEDRAWRRDQGPNVKSIDMSLNSIPGCTRVEISFHEMRIEPDAGACVKK